MSKRQGRVFHNGRRVTEQKIYGSMCNFSNQRNINYYWETVFLANLIDKMVSFLKVKDILLKYAVFNNILYYMNTNKIGLSAH